MGSFMEKIKSLIYSVYDGINLHIMKIFMLPHHPTGYRDRKKQAIVCYFCSAATIHGCLSLQSTRTRRTVNSLGSGECQV